MMASLTLDFRWCFLYLRYNVGHCIGDMTCHQWVVCWGADHQAPFQNLIGVCLWWNPQLVYLGLNKVQVVVYKWMANGLQCNGWMQCLLKLVPSIPANKVYKQKWKKHLIKPLHSITRCPIFILSFVIPEWVGNQLCGTLGTKVSSLRIHDMKYVTHECPWLAVLA